MTIDQVVTLIGLPAIVSILVNFILDSKKAKDSFRFEKLFLEKEHRYRSMLVFMSVVIDEKNYEHIETTYKPKNSNINEYYKREVVLHRNFFVLFAPESVLISIDKFIDNPNHELFDLVAAEMRKDLWNK